jgi:hypothetical protein
MTKSAANERLENQIAKDRTDLLGLQARMKFVRLNRQTFSPTKIRLTPSSPILSSVRLQSKLFGAILQPGTRGDITKSVHRVFNRQNV